MASGPAFADGVQVWLLRYNLSPGESTLVCMRFGYGGSGFADAIGRAIVHYPTHDQSLGSGQTRDGGVLAIPFTVEAIPAGLLIAVDAEIQWNDQWNDRLYGARTQFLSQAVPTITLVSTQVPTEAPTASVAPTPTPTSTNTPTLTPTP